MIEGEIEDITILLTEEDERGYRFLCLKINGELYQSFGFVDVGGEAMLTTNVTQIYEDEDEEVS